MKKTFRMPLLCCLMIAIMLTVSACFVIPSPNSTTPQATTPDTTPEATTPEATTPEPVDPDKPEGAVLVESVNGKKAAELLEEFANNFTNATSYDWSAEMSLTNDEFSITQTLSMKLHDNKFAIVMDTEGELFEIYFTGDALYMNTYGEKIQIPADSIDAVLGEDALDELFYMSSDFEISEAELEAATNANIYFLDDKYIVTVHFTNEDTEQEETSVFYFNAAGELTAAESDAGAEYALLTVHSYNKPVEINPPADADEYTPVTNKDVEPPELPEEEDDIYALYSDISAAVQEADHYWATLEITDVYFMFYREAGENMSVSYDTYDDKTLEQWFIDGKAYERIDYGTIDAVTADEAFFEMFAYFKENFPFDTVAQEKMQNLSCNYFAKFDCIGISFDLANKPGHTAQYKYFFSQDMSYLEVAITEFAEGTEDITAQYLFNISLDTKVELPEERGE